MANPFQLFTTTDYTFLQLESKSGGNTIISETPATGIVKLRDGMFQTDNMEQREARSTVHVKPTEPFLSELDGNLVGHGMRIEKNSTVAEYRIESQVEGYDFDTGYLQFVRVNLKRESVWDESDLPLA